MDSRNVADHFCDLPIPVVSVRANGAGLTLAQTRVDEKSDEIAEHIVDAEADYVPALKGKRACTTSRSSCSSTGSRPTVRPPSCAITTRQ